DARIAVVVLLGLWAGLTGSYAGAMRYEDARLEHRWVHGLAAAGFGVLFVTYHMLLIVCLVWPAGATVVATPAVILCLLLAQIVAGHGFLKFHFGGWYAVLA